MKSLRNLVANRWFILAVVLYLAALLTTTSRRPEFSLGETLIELAIFGFAFPLIAWLTTRRAKRLEMMSIQPTQKCSLWSGYVLALVALSRVPSAGDRFLVAQRLDSV